MTKLLRSIQRIALFSLLTLGATAYGQTAGFNNTFIVLSVNGGSNTYYDLNAATANPDFNNTNLGTFCQGSSGIVFKGAEHNVYKCGGCDLSSTRIYYRIYPQGSPSGTFVSNNIGYNSGFGNGCGGQDQQWANVGYNVNLLSGLPAGTYTIEVYSDATTNCIGTVYASNGGSNYKANFTVNANVTYYADVDGDGFGNPGVTQVSCTGAPAGYVANNTDCNDADPSAHQTFSFFVDNDGDSYGSTTSAMVCAASAGTAPAGYSLNNTDCNDGNATIFTASEIYVDNDGDNYDDGSLVICHGDTAPLGFSFTTNGTDCDDTNANVYQSGMFYVDADGDHYSNSNLEMVCYGATIPEGYSQTNLGPDCNDNDANAYQMGLLYIDADFDGYSGGDFDFVCYGSSIPAGYTDNDFELDCDDSDGSVHPNATEIPNNGIDDDCDGETDEGGTPVTTTILTSQCGTTLATISKPIGAVNSTSYTAYRFRATNVNTSEAYTIVKSVPNFQLTNLPNYDYATTYNVDVEVQVNGIWQGAYGPSCQISTPAILNNGGAAQVNPSQCGITLPSLSTLIATTSLAGVTGYRFRVTNTISNQVQVIDRTLHWFSLTMLGSFNYGTTYSVEVAVKTTGNYTAYGNPCFVSTPEVPGLVNCGAVIASPYTNIATVSLNRVTTYSFEITNLSDFTTQVVNKSVHYFSFSSVPGYAPGTDYAVRVSMMTSGSWSPQSEACIITSPGAARSGVKGEVSEPALVYRAVAYPNPYSESFALDMDTEAQGSVNVKVYDMVGRLVEEKVLAVDQVETQQFGEQFPSGVYNVIVTHNDWTRTLRVIKR